MFANVATAVSSSTAITFALLYAMSLLITFQPQAVVEPASPWTIDWVKLEKQDDPPETLTPPLPPEILNPPRPPAERAPASGDPVLAVSAPSSAPPAVAPYTGPGTLVQDGPLVSMVRPQPVYPARALRQGLEGWVVVQFDVLADGRVANVAIVDSSDPVFEGAARDAAMKFRFKPRVVDGVATSTPGVQNLFRFRMND